MQQRITIESIESKEFTISKTGYNQDEVDAFLDDICDEMERQINQINKLQQELRQAQVAATRPAVSQPQSAVVSRENEESFREILEMAQKVKDETISGAKAQAEDIIAEAKRRAEEQLGDLSAQRESLQAQVDTLKKTVSDYRTHFESLLAEQKSALEKIASL